MNTKERAILVAEKVHAGQLYDIYSYEIKKAWDMLNEISGF